MIRNAKITLRTGKDVTLSDVDIFQHAKQRATELYAKYPTEEAAFLDTAVVEALTLYKKKMGDRFSAKYEDLFKSVFATEYQALQELARKAK